MNYENHISGGSSPAVSRLYPTLKYDNEGTEISCISTGVPQPSIAWLLNGSVVTSSSTEKGLIANVNTELVNLENGTNTYRVYSKIVIKAQKLPLPIQCVASNEMGIAYSENVYILQAAGKCILILVH